MVLAKLINYLSLIQIKDTERVVNILSIGIITMLILLIISLVKVYKLKEKVKLLEQKK
jgi:biopolymer transport protein ExbB/TolQ